MKILVLLIGCILSLPSFAELTCSANGTRLIYVNGVRTEKWEADDAMIAMYELVPINQLDKTNRVEPFLSYNYTYGFARDFLETIVQRFPREFLVSNGFKDGYAAYMKLMQGTLISKLSPVILDDIINSAEELEALALNLTRDTSALVTHYEDALIEGYKILAISHSQGGLFMNEAYSRLQNIKKEVLFAGLQIATPVNEAPIPLFSYVTNDNDRVINLVRSQYGALDANIDVFFASNTFNGLGDVPDFFLNHGLVTTYLHDSTIKAKVISELKVVAQKLESNCVKSTCGTQFRSPDNLSVQRLYACSDSEGTIVIFGYLNLPGFTDLKSSVWYADNEIVQSVSGFGGAGFPIVAVVYDFDSIGQHILKHCGVDPNGLYGCIGFYIDTK